MKKIASFMVNHLKLIPGLYVSRKDKFGTEFITTFDIRMTSPNDEPVMNTAEVHTIEHLGATFLRFYLLLAGDYSSEDILPVIKEMFEFIRDFQGEVPGASPRDCGNCLDMNLPMAKYLAGKYLTEVIENIAAFRLTYPA